MENREGVEPPLSALQADAWPFRHLFIVWSPQPESNQQHPNYKNGALPVELCRRIGERTTTYTDPDYNQAVRMRELNPLLSN